jgi:hypothetical protein
VAGGRWPVVGCSSLQRTTGHQQLLTDFTMEPGFRHVPFAFDGGRGDAQRDGSFFNRKTAEKAQLDDAALLRGNGSQLIQRIVERQQIQVLFFDRRAWRARAE